MPSTSCNRWALVPASPTSHGWPTTPQRVTSCPCGRAPSSTGGSRLSGRFPARTAIRRSGRGTRSAPRSSRDGTARPRRTTSPLSWGSAVGGSQNSEIYTTVVGRDARSLTGHGSAGRTGAEGPRPPSPYHLPGKPSMTAHPAIPSATVLAIAGQPPQAGLQVACRSARRSRTPHSRRNINVAGSPVPAAGPDTTG